MTRGRSGSSRPLVTAESSWMRVFCRLAAKPAAVISSPSPAMPAPTAAAVVASIVGASMANPPSSVAATGGDPACRQRGLVVRRGEVARVDAAGCQRRLVGESPAASRGRSRGRRASPRRARRPASGLDAACGQRCLVVRGRRPGVDAPSCQRRLVVRGGQCAGSMPRAASVASSWEAASVPASMPRAASVASSFTADVWMPRAVKPASSWLPTSGVAAMPRAVSPASSCTAMYEGVIPRADSPASSCAPG